MIIKRNYGIDLLRLVLMFMICILHTLGQGGILAASTKGTFSYGTFWFMEILALCAVDSFALISGYTANNKPKKYEKLVNMWFQIFFYSFIITIILILFGVSNNIGIKDIIKCALPITYNKFWYITSYFVLFLAMPILNKYLFALNKNESKKVFIILIVMFSFIGIVFDTFKTYWGYSALWLIVLYCIGVLAKKIKLFESKKTITLLLIMLLSSCAIWLIKIYLGIDRIVYYISPFILLNGIILVILFSRIKLKENIISKLSPLALGIYLLQLNEVIWNNILKNAFTFVNEKNLVIGILLVLLISLIIFVSGLVIEWIRQKISRLIKIPELSKKIVLLINNLLEKPFSLLK